MPIPFAALTLACSLAPVQDDAATNKVTLAVMVAVDQLIPEQLERLDPLLEGGLGRLYRDGVVFSNAWLPYARTETGAGHATFSTGCVPRRHGIVGNSFWDRSLGREQYCVEDTEAVAIQTTGRVEGTGRRSPKNLMRPTFAEIVQRRVPGARVVSISGKDRAAIGMAGRAKGTVLWWDRRGSGFQSSSHYTDALPEFVRTFNSSWTDGLAEWEWTDSVPYGAAGPAAFGTAPDERDGESPRGKNGVSFPYRFPETDQGSALGGFAYGTPLVDRWVAELASTSLDEYELGRRGNLDCLLLSFSGCDVCGHQNGPYSREVTDLLLRLDRVLGDLFAKLDATVGEGRWVCALTSDHGVLPLPEHMRPLGIDSRRIGPSEVAAFRKAFGEKLEAELGARVRHKMGPGGLRLDEEDMTKGDIDPVEARAAAAAVIRGLRVEYDWVYGAWSHEEVAALDADADGLESTLRASFVAERTIDVVVVYAPHVLVGMGKGTSHGSAHEYDRRVPLVFYGSAFGKGRRDDVAGSHDVVPSFFGALGIQVDVAFDGRDLFAR